MIHNSENMACNADRFWRIDGRPVVKPEGGVDVVLAKDFEPSFSSQPELGLVPRRESPPPFLRRSLLSESDRVDICGVNMKFKDVNWTGVDTKW
jgi:hypothetical protein